MASIQISHPLMVNARVLGVPSNGQKRVAEEISRRLAGVELVQPGEASSSGPKGHLWEQTVLPRKARRQNLWSPSTTGPIYHPSHVVTVHDIAFVDEPAWFSRSFAVVYDQVVSRLVRNARHIVTVSDFTRERLIEHYGARPDLVTRIYSGTSVAFRRTQPENTRETLERLRIPDAPYLVAFLGNDPRKNLARIVEAWRIVSDRHPEARLVTFGRTSNARVFKAAEIGEPPDSILHVGPVSDDDLACLYTGSRGLVFPSLYEGFGLPVVEAAACGARVLTSAVSALPEVSAADTLLVDPNSVAHIADAMGELLSASDAPDAIAARIASSRRFDWDTTASLYADLFRRVFA